jgi:hypothetical protein
VRSEAGGEQTLKLSFPIPASTGRNGNQTVKGEKIMNTITYLVTIVSLLLAMAAAGEATQGQAGASSPSATRGAFSRDSPVGCDEWGCGGNHNETLVRDAAPVK